MDENIVAILIFLVGLFTSITLVFFIYINHFKFERHHKNQSDENIMDEHARRES